MTVSARALVIALALLLAVPANAGCPIPVPVQDYTARSRSGSLHALFRSALNHHERHFSLHDRSALSAGYDQRIPAALAPRPAGSYYSARLAGAGATAGVLSAASGHGGYPGAADPSRPHAIRRHDPSDPNDPLLSVLALLIDAALSNIHPGLRPLAQGLLAATGLPARHPAARPPRYASPTARQILGHRNYAVATPRGTAHINGSEALYFFRHRNRGLHHPSDETVLYLPDNSAVVVRLADLYPQLEAQGLHHVLPMLDRQPLPWPPRLLSPGERAALRALGIRIPSGYGYLRPPPGVPDMRAFARNLASRLLAMPRPPESGAPHPRRYGPTARAIGRCVRQSSCDPSRLHRVLSADGRASANQLQHRAHDPLVRIRRDLELPDYSPTPSPSPGPASLLVLQLPGASADAWQPASPPAPASDTLRNAATSGEPTPGDILFATPADNPIELGDVSEARDSFLRNIMLDNLAIGLVSHYRMLDLDSSASAIARRSAQCESSACSMRAWYDALHANAELLSVQARLELALLEQALARLAATTDPLPPRATP